MVVNDSEKNAEKIEKKYFCKCCDFRCSKKSNFNSHLRTLKHLRHENDSKKMPKNAEITPWSCICGRLYKYESGYYRHKKICKIYQNNEPKEEKEEKEELDYKSLFLNMSLNMQKF